MGERLLQKHLNMGKNINNSWEDIIESDSSDLSLKLECEQGPTFLDYLVAAYIIGLFASNYTSLHPFFSNLGLVIGGLLAVNLILTQYRFQREMYFIIAFNVWVAISSLLSDYRLFSWGCVLYLIKNQGIFVIVAIRCRSFRLMKYYLSVILIGVSVIVIPSLFTAYAVRNERLEGVAGEANALGSLAANLTVCCMGLFLLYKGLLKKTVIIVVAIISVRVLLASVSRGGLVTVLVCFVAIWWYIFSKSVGYKKILLLAGLFLVGIVSLYMLRDTAIYRRMLGLFVTFGIEVKEAEYGVGGAMSRVILIQEAIKVWSDYPIFGAGYGTFRFFSEAVYTHTTPFDLLYSTGTVGFLLFYIVLLTGWLALRKGKKFLVLSEDSKKYIIFCQVLIITQLAAGLSLPSQESKIQGAISGVWLGIAWYVRTLLNTRSNETR